MVDCELYHPENKRAVLSKVTEDDLAEIDELSRWVWERRFFMPEHGWTIGGNMVKSVHKGNKNKV